MLEIGRDAHEQICYWSGENHVNSSGVPFWWRKGFWMSMENIDFQCVLEGFCSTPVLFRFSCGWALILDYYVTENVMNSFTFTINLETSEFTRFDPTKTSQDGMHVRTPLPHAPGTRMTVFHKLTQTRLVETLTSRLFKEMCGEDWKTLNPRYFRKRSSDHLRTVSFDDLLNFLFLISFIITPKYYSEFQRSRRKCRQTYTGTLLINSACEDEYAY